MSRLNQGGIGILLIVLFLIGYVVGACGKENIAACESLTVRFAEDGSFQYLGNEILNNGNRHIPDYQYRIKEEH
jgi:hypothetical protein